MTHQFITNRWGNGDDGDEGTVKYYNTGSVIYPVICVKRHNTLVWVRFNELSSALWMCHRDSIEPEWISHSRPLWMSHLRASEENKTNKLVMSLLSTLSVEQRQKWVSENSEYKDKICTECGSLDPEKKKCIHYDCSGMCATCFDIKNKPGFENCSCCLQKQEITCPICQEDFPTDNLVKSEQCSHHICWSCFGRSIKSSRPLSNCPLCRSVFCDKLVDLEEYADMPALEGDDMSPLVDDASERDEQFAMARAQEGMDFDEIMAAVANGFVSVRNDGMEV
jgi:hypothetical protein